MKVSSPVVKHLVLIGGGHSHLAVLRSFGMKPMPGLAITLITRDVLTPYSGSLPGFLAGNIGFEDMHIDLRPLAQFAGAKLIQQTVEDIDLEAKEVRLAGRPAIGFDLLSLNIGSRPATTQIAGAAAHATAVKPIDQFIQQWDCWREEAVARLSAGTDYGFVIVGGGPASVEIAFATQQRIRKELDQHKGGQGKQSNGGELEQQPSGRDRENISGESDQQPSKRDRENISGEPNQQPAKRGQLRISIVSMEPELLARHNVKVRGFAEAELRRRNITVKPDTTVVEIKPGRVVCANGEELPADAIIYATGASLPQWPFDCGLSRSGDGFISVKNTLQSSSHDFVFAAGDAATVEQEPRPKSGVYAVRQGKVLATNLRRFATGKSLRHYFPQRQALALLSLGDGQAIASRGGLFMQGRMMGYLKHRIDSRFVRQFSRLPAMAISLDLEPGLADKALATQLAQHAMRCAGCGAKVAADVLGEVLDELEAPRKPEIVTTAGGIEDASRITLGDGRTLVQSIDYVKAFSTDPWLFAQIATQHCLSDIHAMGVKPHSALAMVGLPFAAKRFSRQQLRELMLACKSVLEAEDCDLIGGHSAESAELQLGFCINAFADEQAILTKAGARPGDAIILTKALGTGSLLAADMRYLAGHTIMQSAFASMLQSNGLAAELLRQHRATACTDVTGFGLAGHLLELTNASGCHAEIQLPQVAALPGVLDLLEKRIFSSLHFENRLNARHIDLPHGASADRDSASPLFELLFDPQTSGGLLAAVPADAAQSCVSALHGAGYEAAAVIGSFSTDEAGVPPLKLRV